MKKSLVILLAMISTLSIEGCKTENHIHTWDEGIITKTATCAESGEKTFTCNCGETKIENIIVEHNVMNGKCSVCNYVKPNTEIRITGTDQIPDFYISNTELTYDRWHEVYQWAIKNGYVFANPGKEGSNFATTGINSKQPVTTISWRDIVVWCNAASQKDGLSPVYYLEGTTDFSDTSKILKTADNKNVLNGKGLADHSVMNHSANGYRLPTETEWLYAAKGGEDYDYSGSNNIDKVAWYNANSMYYSNPVGTKSANAFALYDMTGNLWELCWNTYAEKISKNNSCNYDFFDEENDRIIRGGCYANQQSSCSFSYFAARATFDALESTGFRFARNGD